jgi:hypothetical protein
MRPYRTPMILLSACIVTLAVQNPSPALLILAALNVISCYFLVK